MKTCSACKKEKDLALFNKNKAQKDGCANQCKSCYNISNSKWRLKNKERIKAQQKVYRETVYKKIASERYKNNKDFYKDYKLKQKYGINLDQHNQMLKNQNDCCAICSKHKNEFKEALAVDHCHENGKVRGLLCINCNNGLGRFKDSSNIVGNAFIYLQGHGQ